MNVRKQNESLVTIFLTIINDHFREILPSKLDGSLACMLSDIPASSVYILFLI